MKKLIMILVPLMMLSTIWAIEFDWDGNFRTRAAMYNDEAEDNGGHIDSRLQLNMHGRFAPNWELVLGTEIGNTNWGGFGGGVGTGGVNIETSELYLHHNWIAKGLEFKLGQQWYADHRSMVLDDFISGLYISKDDVAGMKAELAYFKANERNTMINDDYHIVMFNLLMDENKAGLQTFYGNDLKANGMANFTIMPFYTVPVGSANLDVTAFVDYQVVPGDDQLGFGAAVKADAELSDLDLGLDILYIGENGLTVLSPYYQNGLYLFGWGNWHDGTTIDFPYPDGDQGLLSAVGQLKYPLNQKMAIFGNLGYVTTMADNDPAVGLEANAGLEICLVPEIAKMAVYGAFGNPGKWTDGDPNALYMLGSSIKVEF